MSLKKKKSVSTLVFRVNKTEQQNRGWKCHQHCALSYKALTSHLTPEPRQQLLNTPQLRQSLNERRGEAGEKSTLPHSLWGPQGPCRPGSWLHDNAHFGGKRKKKKKKKLQEFWLIHFSCVSTKMAWNIFHFQRRLFDEIQISRNPISAPSPEQREVSKTQKLFPLSYWIYSITRLFGSDSLFSALHCQGRNWILNLFFIWSQG